MTDKNEKETGYSYIGLDEMQENYPSAITIMKEREQLNGLSRKGACACKRGIERDNCPNCEGSGIQIDWHAFHKKLKLK